jgi:hypothetical protein
MFRLRVSALLALGALATLGCDSVRFDGPERQIVGDSVSREADSDWAGERLSVLNNRGDVTVVGMPNLTRIRLTARPSTLANDRADAEAALPDVAANIRIERADGTWLIGCNRASADHGSADADDAGCAELVVQVPSGSESSPLDLWVAAKFGGARVSGVTGSARVKASYDLAASVTPVSGSHVSIASNEDSTNGTCHASLALPASLAGNVFVAAFKPGAQVHSQFPELPVGTCTAYPSFTEQPVYPGTDPYPCIQGSLPGLSPAPQIELLAMHGDATLARGLDAPLTFVPGTCAVE